MASFKITLLVLAALGMAQGHSVAKRASVSPLEFIGSVETVMANAMTNIKTSAAELKTNVDAATTKLTGYINIARAAQANAKQAAQNQIDAIKANATAVAATQNGTQACTTLLKGDLEALGAQTLLLVVDCIGKKITELENMLQTVVDTGNTALTMVPVAIADVDACHTKGGFWEALCHFNATMTFVGKVNSVIVNITGVVAGATSLVSTIQADLTTCATIEVGKMAIGAAAEVVKFGICAGKSAIQSG